MIPNRPTDFTSSSYFAKRWKMKFAVALVLGVDHQIRTAFVIANLDGLGGEDIHSNEYGGAIFDAHCERSSMFDL
jgi:hypothetical protein